MTVKRERDAMSTPPRLRRTDRTDEVGQAVSGKTLGGHEGYPYSRGAAERLSIRLVEAATIAAAGLALATWALAIAVAEVPTPGLIADAPPGGRVLEVFPGGPAWRSGVRAGDEVVTLDPGERPEDWTMETRRAASVRFVRVASYVTELREVVPFAVVGVALGAAGVGLVRIAPAAAGGLGALSASIASVPLLLSGSGLASSIGGAAAVLLPASWLGLVLAGRARWVLVLMALAVTLAWLIARYAQPGTFDLAEQTRLGSSLLIGGATGALLVRWVSVGRLVERVGAPRALDLLTVSVAAGLALSAWLILEVPLVAVAIGLLAVAVLYPRWREVGTRLLDRLFLMDARQRASIAAVESERARLARHIHDEPLQELSGAIRRLELVPGTKGETDLLRNIARQLRAVATDLHPPVLQDLGIGAGLEFLAHQASSSGTATPVTCELTEPGRFNAGDRPPPEVELAAYRIAQEAIANAQRHGSAAHIRIRGDFDSHFLEVAIEDDGVGISDGAVLRAQRNAHLGVASMRERAALVGASLRVAGRAGGGTLVEFRWPPP